MIQRILITSLLIVVACFPRLLRAQSHYTISGYIHDAQTGESLIGASIYDQRTLQGNFTNEYGYYSITLNEGEVWLTASYLGYQTLSDTFILKENTSRNIKLTSGVQLQEVVVTADETNSKIEERTQMSAMEIPMEQLKKLPALFGETDVLRTLQLLPGVSGGGEGSTGLFVRGGTPDQNLILLDGVPVYNASHLFGFFSVFNPDAINHVELYKGAFPARYGGRLSSVIDIRMKEGNAKQLVANGSVGLIASKLTVEGPIKNENTSFMISGRRTYIDLLAQPFIIAASNGEGTGGYYFWDLNGKINHRFNDRNRLYLSGYFGQDRFYFKDLSGGQDEELKGHLQWGNVTAVARWNHVFTKNLFSNVTGTFTRYQFETGETSVTNNNDGTQNQFALRYFSGIFDISGKIDFNYLPVNNHSIRFGTDITYHKFRPGAVQIKINITDFNEDTTYASDFIPATEWNLYGEDDWTISSTMSANLGIHYSGFLVKEKIYHSIQPRLSFRYQFHPSWSAKASIVRMTQYIHLLTNSTVGLPTDLWVPSTDIIHPEESWQGAIGVAHTLHEKFEVSAEGYYKIMNNLIEYKEGASYLNSNVDEWDTKVEVGDGTSYGGELFIQKKTGRLTGLLGYTLAWNWRKFDNLNFGEKFPFRYDHRHDFEIAAVYKLKPNIELSGEWVYETGNAITLPIAAYEGSSLFYDAYQSNGSVQYYSSRNGFRMKAYHRIDISISFIKQKKWGERTWNISVYNAYSRKNPYFIYLTSVYNYQTQTSSPVFKQVSLFPILPSISYSFKINKWKK
ncbi:MAG TPA: TonB-dependent receptor [Chitinophagales bacterium]|nr:TonB-dependent receptor [Chitinophagales bacterium]